MYRLSSATFCAYTKQGPIDISRSGLFCALSLIPCCDLLYEFRIITMLVCRRAHVLFSLFMFVCIQWCPARADFVSNMTSVLFTLFRRVGLHHGCTHMHVGMGVHQLEHNLEQHNNNLYRNTYTHFRFLAGCVRVFQFLVFCVVFCRSLIGCFPIFFCPSVCLPFFKLWLFITLLVASRFSSHKTLRFTQLFIIALWFYHYKQVSFAKFYIQTSSFASFSYSHGLPIIMFISFITLLDKVSL